MKTLYISDLDGTLLQPNVELSNKTKRILNELIDQGMLFSVATARTIATVRSILNDVAINMPIILMNGACVYDWNKKEYIKIEHLPQESKRFLLDIITKYQIKGFAYVIKDGNLSTYYTDITSKPMKDFYEERVSKYNKPFIKIKDFSSLADEPLIYFSLMDKKELIEPIYNAIKDDPNINSVFYQDNYTSNVWYLELFSKHASKYHAVKFLRSYLQLDQIVCFGDNRNDLPLFEASDRKFAVANAVTELKCKADKIIASNKDDAVACWLSKNALLAELEP